MEYKAPPSNELRHCLNKSTNRGLGRTKTPVTYIFFKVYIYIAPLLCYKPTNTSLFKKGSFKVIFIHFNVNIFGNLFFIVDFKELQSSS